MKQKYSKDFEGTQKAPGDERDLCSRGLSKHDAHSCTSTLHPSAFALAPSRFTIHTQTIASTTTSTILSQSWWRKWVASRMLPTGGNGLSCSDGAGTPGVGSWCVRPGYQERIFNRENNRWAVASGDVCREISSEWERHACWTSQHSSTFFPELSWLRAGTMKQSARRCTRAWAWGFR